MNPTKMTEIPENLRDPEKYPQIKHLSGHLFTIMVTPKDSGNTPLYNIVSAKTGETLLKSPVIYIGLLKSANCCHICLSGNGEGIFSIEDEKVILPPSQDYVYHFGDGYFKVSSYKYQYFGIFSAKPEPKMIVPDGQYADVAYLGNHLFQLVKSAGGEQLEYRFNALTGELALTPASVKNLEAKAAFADR